MIGLYLVYVYDVHKENVTALQPTNREKNGKTHIHQDWLLIHPKTQLLTSGIGSFCTKDCFLSIMKLDLEGPKRNSVWWCCSLLFPTCYQGLGQPARQSLSKLAFEITSCSWIVLGSKMRNISMFFAIFSEGQTTSHLEWCLRSSPMCTSIWEPFSH